MDVSSEESVACVVQQLYRLGDESVELVNSAGIVENDVGADEMRMETYDRVMGVNLRGVFLSCREFGRELLARGGGAIVNIASMSGNHVVNHSPAPERLQHFQGRSRCPDALPCRGMGRCGVRVNCVSPGYVETPLNALKKHMHQGWIDETIVGRFAKVTEIASAVEYLLSEEAAYCCGTELLIDGGSSLR